MTISDAQFAAWLADDQRKKIVLAELQYVFEGSASTNLVLGRPATASSTISSQYAAAKATDGELIGRVAGLDSYWNSTPLNAFPQYWWCTLSAPASINKVVVYSVADDFITRSTAPSDTETGALYVLSDFDVEVRYSAGWKIVASVTGNALLKRTVVFPGEPCLDLRVRINKVAGAAAGYARLVEFQAYKAQPTVGTIFLSNLPYATEPGTFVGEVDYGNIQYRAVIESTPSYTRAIDRQTLGGHVGISFGDLIIANEDQHSSFLLDVILDGRDVSFYIGDESWSRADFRLLFSAGAIMAQQKAGKVAVSLKDKGYALDKSTISSPLGGTGPNKDKPVPLLISERQIYVEAILADSSTLRYVVASAVLAPVTIGVVYADGIKLSGTQWTDNGDGSFTLLVAANGAKLIAGCTGKLLSANGIGYANTTAKNLLSFLWGSINGAATIYGKHPSWDSYQDGTFSPTLFDLDLVVDLYLAARYNVAEVMDQVAFTANAFWGTRRDGKFTYGRIRPNDLEKTLISNDTHSDFGTPASYHLAWIGTFVDAPTLTLTDDDVLGDVSTERMPPLYGKVLRKFAKHATFETIAAGIPTEALASIWRDEFFHDSGPVPAPQLSDYNAVPTSYHRTMTDSPEFEVLDPGQSGGGIDSAYFFVPFDPSALPVADPFWLAWRRDMFLPHIEIRSFTTRLTHYDLEPGDVVSVNMPNKAADTAAANWQVIGIGLAPVTSNPGQVTLTLIRRRKPQLTQVIDGVTSAVVTVPPIGTAHAQVYETQLLSGNRVFTSQRV